MEKEELKEKREIVADTIGEMFEKMLKKDVKDGRISEERAEITREKLKLQTENYKLATELREVSDNTYPEIGRILNDYYRQDNNAMQEALDRCKKYLDENNLPYQEKEEED